MTNCVAQRIHAFGSPAQIVTEAVQLPDPASGEILVRVRAAGVGPWDALVREGRIGANVPPLTLGAEVAGEVAAIGRDVPSVQIGDALYGVTSRHFVGGYAEYALCRAASMARAPRAVEWSSAAALPIAMSTAWQMLFVCARVEQGMRVLVHGASGAVGDAAVQLAHHAGAVVVAMTAADDAEHLYRGGADLVTDYRPGPFGRRVDPVDVVIDTIGGEIAQRSFPITKRGGTIVSSVRAPDPELAKSYGVEVRHIVVDVAAAQLDQIATLVEAGAVVPRIARILPLTEARRAHELLADPARPPGTIVLQA